jgi:NAD-dependent dihydropyrimidine dehydrogenase PreA subunit
MGIAVMDHARCLRGPFDDELSPDASESQVTGPGFHGEDCRLCVTSCPVGETAMTIDGMGKISIIAGCIGCGVCERACPTEPSSVYVRVE